MPTFLTSSILKKILEKNKIEPGIFFMDYGFLTFSWEESSKIKIGLFFAQMNVQDFLMSGDKNLRNYTWAMRLKEEVEELSKLDSCGRLL